MKQLFLYLTVEYSTPNNKHNEVVLWDKIIKRGSKANILYKKLATKYFFWDDGHGLKGNNNLTIRLHWNSIPNVGWLTFNVAEGSHTFSFPSQYVNSKQ